MQIKILFIFSQRTSYGAFDFILFPFVYLLLLLLLLLLLPFRTVKKLLKIQGKGQLTHVDYVYFSVV